MHASGMNISINECKWLYKWSGYIRGYKYTWMKLRMTVRINKYVLGWMSRWIEMKESDKRKGLNGVLVYLGVNWSKTETGIVIK